MDVPQGSDPADHAARLLALVLERAPRTAAELAAAVGADERELEAPLAALERYGLVGWDSARTQLGPGPVALRFARSGGGREDLIAHAEPSMKRLAQRAARP